MKKLLLATLFVPLSLVVGASAAFAQTASSTPFVPDVNTQLPSSHGGPQFSIIAAIPAIGKTGAEVLIIKQLIALDQQLLSLLQQTN